MRITTECRFPNGGTIEFTAITDLTGHGYVSAVGERWIHQKLHQLARELEAEANRAISKRHHVE